MEKLANENIPEKPESKFGLPEYSVFRFTRFFVFISVLLVKISG
jgi:hypothetical protein